MRRNWMIVKLRYENTPSLGNVVIAEVYNLAKMWIA
jgi:hypothetical protein